MGRKPPEPHPTLLTPIPPPQKLAWEQQEPAERRLNFVPQQYRCLRAVPGYPRFIHERFERCLDLYLCPRQRKMRVRASLTPNPPHPRVLGEDAQSRHCSLRCMRPGAGSRWCTRSRDGVPGRVPLCASRR